MSQPQYIDAFRRTLEAAGCESYYQWLEGLHPHTHGAPGFCFSCESVISGDSFLEQVPFNEMGWICASCGSEEVHGLVALVQKCRDEGITVD